MFVAKYRNLVLNLAPKLPITMRTISFSLLVLLLGAACSEERQILNRIEGTFETMEFVVTDDTTGNVLFTASPTFQFAECDGDSNGSGGRCEVTIIDSAGVSYNYMYQLTVADQGPNFINFRLPNLPGNEDTDLTRALSGVLTIELRDEELNILTDTDSRVIQDAIQGSKSYQVSIVAIKR